MTGIKCDACGATGPPGPSSADPTSGTQFCVGCEKTFPPSLLKAVCDHPFAYALGLRSGEIILFSRASIHGEWVTLTNDNAVDHGDRPAKSIPLPLERGVDIRAADILWCADAPYGP